MKLEMLAKGFVSSAMSEPRALSSTPTTLPVRSPRELSAASATMRSVSLEERMALVMMCTVSLTWTAPSATLSTMPAPLPMRPSTVFSTPSALEE